MGWLPLRLVLKLQANHPGCADIVWPAASGMLHLLHPFPQEQQLN